MGQGSGFRWRSLRAVSDSISRTRQRLREAKASPPTSLPIPHKNALYRLAILMHQMGQAPLPGAGLPVIQGDVPVQRLLRLAPPKPVQQSQDDSNNTENLAGDHDISAGGISAEDGHVTQVLSTDDDRPVADRSGRMQDENDLSENAAEAHPSDIEDASNWPEDDGSLAGTLDATIEYNKKELARLARKKKHINKKMKRLRGTVRRLTKRAHQ